MKVLVTGGAGFIGSHVCERLLHAGHEVSIVDDLNDFYSPEEKLANVAAVRACGPIEFLHADLAAARPLFETFRPDAVIHLAARAGIRPSFRDPLLYERVNVQATGDLLDLCREHDVRRFVFTSSSSVYGDACAAPFREDDTRCAPLSPYAATKLAAESVCREYSERHGIDAVCLRLFTVYGPRQRPDLAIRQFAEHIERGEPVRVYGDGSSARDYTYIDDIAAGIVSSLSLAARFEIVNLGNSRPIDLLAVVRTLENALGRAAAIEHLPDQPGDVRLTCASIEKARCLLDYSPQTSFEHGIHRFVEWLRGT